MTWLPTPDHALRGGVLALRPDATRRAAELEAAVREDDRLDPRIVELVRRRVAHVLGLPGAVFDPTDVRTAHETAALDFAEQYVVDPSGVTDEQAARLNELFDEPALTSLTFAVAVYDAMARVQLVLGLDAHELPGGPLTDVRG
jgi:alkylhydroperoxidase family enzyme